MNQELAIILRDKLVGLPFVDVIGGIAKTVITTESNQDGGAAITKRFPVCDNVLGVDCKGKEIAMHPDSSRKSIIYFEDFGIVAMDPLRMMPGFTSSIRLVCWMNRAKTVGDIYKPVSGRVISEILNKLISNSPQNVDILTRLSIRLARIQPQDPGLFGRYTYKEAETQYLRPPFEYFGIDFTCKFYVSSKCFSYINWNNPLCY